MHKERYMYGAFYTEGDVKVRFHYQDLPSFCGFCGKPVDNYLVRELRGQDEKYAVICKDCLKKLNKIYKEYEKDSEKDENPKVRLIATYKEGVYHYE